MDCRVLGCIDPFGHGRFLEDAERPLMDETRKRERFRADGRDEMRWYDMISRVMEEGI